MAYIVRTPVTSTSHALGRNASLIMLMLVQTLHPWFCWTEVQHWIAVASSCCSDTNWSRMTPMRAIWIIRGPGTWVASA